MFRIRSGDFVEVISGKDKGKTGKVLKMFPKEGKCIVEKVGVVKRHQKAKQGGTPAGIIEKPTKIHLCKVAVLDPKTKKPSRVRIEISGDKRVRKYVKSGEVVEAATA